MTPYMLSSHGLLWRPSLSFVHGTDTRVREEATSSLNSESSRQFVLVLNPRVLSGFPFVLCLNDERLGPVLLVLKVVYFWNRSKKCVIIYACLTKPLCVWLVRWRRYYDDKALGGKKVQPSAVLKENCSSTPSRVSRLCVMRNKILLVKTAVAALYYTTAQYSKLKIHGARTGQNTADDSIGNKGAVAIRCIVVYLVQLAK